MAKIRNRDYTVWKVVIEKDGFATKELIRVGRHYAEVERHVQLAKDRTLKITLVRGT